jgi:hypothetical protein
MDNADKIQHIIKAKSLQIIVMDSIGSIKIIILIKIITMAALAITIKP